MTRQRNTKTEEKNSEQLLEAKSNEEVTDAPKPRTEDKKNTEFKPAFTGYVHIDTFLHTAQIMFDMKESQVAGFKAFMHGKYYMFDDREFIPYLEEYLGRKLDI